MYPQTGEARPRAARCARRKKGRGSSQLPLPISPVLKGREPSTGQRRPALPRASPAVPSARCGLASGFGMGPGVPRTLWPLTGGRRSAHPGVLACPEGRTATTDRMARPGASRSGDARARERAGRPAARCGVRARAISTARLRGSHPLHLPPIEPVVYRCPYRKEN